MESRGRFYKNDGRVSVSHLQRQIPRGRYMFICVFARKTALYFFTYAMHRRLMLRGYFDNFCRRDKTHYFCERDFITILVSDLRRDSRLAYIKRYSPQI